MLRYRTKLTTEVHPHIGVNFRSSPPYRGELRKFTPPSSPPFSCRKLFIRGELQKFPPPRCGFHAAGFGGCRILVGRRPPQNRARRIFGLGSRPLIGAPANFGQNLCFVPKGQPNPPNCLLAQTPGPLTPKFRIPRAQQLRIGKCEKQGWGGLL